MLPCRAPGIDRRQRASGGFQKLLEQAARHLAIGDCPGVGFLHGQPLFVRLPVALYIQRPDVPFGRPLHDHREISLAHLLHKPAPIAVLIEIERAVVDVARTLALAPVPEEPAGCRVNRRAGIMGV